MNKMFVSPWLMVSPDGPVTSALDKPGLIHMRQGDADAACGPYALMMEAEPWEAGAICTHSQHMNNVLLRSLASKHETE